MHIIIFHVQVQRQLEGQLVMFEAQINSCAPEIKDEVRKQLQAVTLSWAGSRQQNGFQNSTVDVYTTKLLEILTEGKTEHPQAFSEMQIELFYF